VDGGVGQSPQSPPPTDATGLRTETQDDGHSRPMAPVQTTAYPGLPGLSSCSTRTTHFDIFECSRDHYPKQCIDVL